MSKKQQMFVVKVTKPGKAPGSVRSYWASRTSHGLALTPYRAHRKVYYDFERALEACEDFGNGASVILVEGGREVKIQHAF